MATAEWRNDSRRQFEELLRPIATHHFVQLRVGQREHRAAVIGHHGAWLAPHPSHHPRLQCDEARLNQKALKFDDKHPARGHFRFGSGPMMNNP